jgi:hypothetical protein
MTRIGSSAATRTDGRGLSLGGGAAQGGDPHREPEVAVEQVAQVADARGAVETPPVDAPARRVDASVPGLAARDQPDHLEQNGGAENQQRGAAERRA